jgi:hypothetical protein
MTDFKCINGIFEVGHPTMARAIMGEPPMAYTSLMALAAAMHPKS